MVKRMRYRRRQIEFPLSAIREQNINCFVVCVLLNKSISHAFIGAESSVEIRETDCFQAVHIPVRFGQGVLESTGAPTLVEAHERFVFAHVLAKRVIRLLQEL